MGNNIRGNYYEDTYIKYECQSCKRCFIVGEKISEGMHIACSYCQSFNIKTVAFCTETEDMDMGCLGLYYHLDDDGSLMLSSEREFIEALSGYGFAIPATGIANCIKQDYAKRDARK